MGVNGRVAAVHAVAVDAPQCGGATKAGCLEIGDLQIVFVAVLLCIAPRNGLAAPHKDDHNIGTEIHRYL